MTALKEVTHGWSFTCCIVNLYRGASLIRNSAPIGPYGRTCCIVNLYRGASLIRNCPPLGPYSRTMPRALWRSWGGRGVLVSEVTL